MPIDRRIRNVGVRPEDGYVKLENLSIKLTIWDDGFTMEVTCLIPYVDPITHQLREAVKPCEIMRVAFEVVVGVGGPNKIR